MDLTKILTLSMLQTTLFEVLLHNLKTKLGLLVSI